MGRSRKSYYYYCYYCYFIVTIILTTGMIITTTTIYLAETDKGQATAGQQRLQEQPRDTFSPPLAKAVGYEGRWHQVRSCPSDSEHNRP